MPPNKLRKQILILSVIVVCGFTGAYLFMIKHYAETHSGQLAEIIKKDTVEAVSLLSENFDFENTEGASVEKAASGKKSFKITPSLEYGFGISKTIKDILNYQSLNEIDIELKCWMKKKLNAVYVLSVEDPNSKIIFWDSKPILSDKIGDWSTIHFIFNIKPEAIKPGYIIKLYPWNKAKEEFYMDDISVNYMGMGTANNTPAAQTSTTHFFYAFENKDGLTGTECIKQTTAHSGKMACDLTGGREYGPLVIKQISDVSTTPLKKINASVWVYPLADKTNTVLTASITNSKGENIFWEGKSTESSPFPKNKWTKLNVCFNIPAEKVSPEDKLQVNVWNKGRTDVIIDDLEIVYGEGPDRKGETSTIDANSIYEKQFVPQKNKPPFNTIYFTKQEINTSAIAHFTPNDEYLVVDFIKDKNNLDELICIQNGKAILYAYNSETKQFKAVSRKSSPADSLLKIKTTSDNGKDKTFFKPTDITFPGDYFGDNKTEILEFNSDWRFDLKLIKKEKEDVTVLGNIDFKGYSNDYNPKYYEFTKIVSGKFINSAKSSLLIINCNCADADFNGKHCKQFENNPALPNSVGLYSIETK